ncbi:glycosyltransferase family 4 protein [Spirosoma aerolatum]|uniref:glycosyltransferase family 4 protein n=1 Tax=Spirosoma aerolatum TaxID=1211326 RepID=UPI0009AC3506|nr:glycosyltransferase family 4 protein [Spirosoma aerolatum]
MKVLHLNHSDFNGGAAKASYRLHTSLRRIGVESTMLVKHKELLDSTTLEASYFANTGFLRIVDKYSWKVKNYLNKRKWKRYPHKQNVFMNDLGSISLKKALATIDFDILHLHWITLQFLDINELVKINKPIVWTLHDSWPFTGGCHFFYKCENYKSKCGNCQFLNSNSEYDLTREIWHRKKEVYKQCKIFVVSPSNWLAECAKASSLFNSFPITVIPNGINTDTFQPKMNNSFKEFISYNASTKYILFGAVNSTSDKNKGYHLLIEAINSLKSKTTIEIELIVFGSDSINDSNLRDFQTHYLGKLSNEHVLADAYNLADVVVVPSMSENLSNVIMETLSCGKPVVAFDIGGNSDMIKHLENGLLVPPFSTEQFAEAILWALNVNVDKHLNIKARKTAVENYSENIIAESYLDLYKRILN